ncbi:MAG: flagellar biosynthetic protein FliO [Oceanicoccus sp.]
MTIHRVLFAAFLLSHCIVSVAAVTKLDPLGSDIEIEQPDVIPKVQREDDSVENTSAAATALLADEKAIEKSQPSSSFTFNPGNVNRSTEVGSGVVTTNPLSVVVGLLAVVLLIFLLAWLMRRLGGVSAMGGQQMKVMAALSVGAREKVVLVEIGDQQILVGVAPGRVSHLQSFEQPILESPVSRGDFPSAMKKILQKNISGASAKKGGE